MALLLLAALLLLQTNTGSLEGTITRDRSAQPVSDAGASPFNPSLKTPIYFSRGSPNFGVFRIVSTSTAVISPAASL